ncbi:type II toxin-antitoxin system Phd/YefM family antitoxin [Candidatus Peregrinibacteria bacterium]|nr:type II toxin-antitoxin system Phd/YefM family antitoxin [Candidatus Peregrinibacteria bacterium]
MYIVQNTIKISDLRKNTNEIIEEVEKADQPITVFSRSEPKIIIMSCKTYKKLKEPEKLNTKGIDFFINPPEGFLIKEKGLDAVKLIREERN